MWYPPIIAQRCYLRTEDSLRATSILMLGLRPAPLTAHGVTFLLFLHTYISLHFGGRPWTLHAVFARLEAGGIVTQIANRMVGSDYAMRLGPSCLNQSIIWFLATAVCCRPACAVLAHNVSDGIALAPVPHGERSCRAVTDGMGMRVPLPCMKSSNGSHHLRMVRAARARNLPIRMVRAARARDLPIRIRMVRAARARDLPNQMRPFGSRTWPPFRHTALHAARQSRRRSGICTPRLPRSAGRGPR